ncbi:hypothetical protein SDC9_182109 [bioreactor metagenome]|uniref:Uncharacterized protein n=1 Tax=bioreactor metagenome TaxID=1076179 RepID=A0A645H6K3_9ZZZZ
MAQARLRITHIHSRTRKAAAVRRPQQRLNFFDIHIALPPPLKFQIAAAAFGKSSNALRACAQSRSTRCLHYNMVLKACKQRHGKQAGRRSLQFPYLSGCFVIYMLIEALAQSTFASSNISTLTTAMRAPHTTCFATARASPVTGRI